MAGIDFAEEMLKRAKEKKETVPQTRTQGVDSKEVEAIVEQIKKFGKDDNKKEVS